MTLTEATPSTPVLAWLLAGDPAIRWQVMRDLVNGTAQDIETERSQVASSGWGSHLLTLQDPAGTWAGSLYSPKWTSTTYTLLVLKDCGLITGHPAALRGVELIWEGARYFDGGLTSAASVDFPEACVTSIYVALARYFGFDDPRVDDAQGWLLENQLEDGGWNCRNVRYGDRHSSVHTTILALEALEEARRRGATDVVTAAIDHGREFFLHHRLFRSHRNGSTIDPAFTRFSFPPRWHYDDLRGLDHFATSHAPGTSDCATH
jgi:hypothetical protein